MLASFVTSQRNLTLQAQWSVILPPDPLCGHHNFYTHFLFYLYVVSYLRSIELRGVMRWGFAFGACYFRALPGRNKLPALL